MYFIKKTREYFIPKINQKEMENVLENLSEIEKKIFLEMPNYDKFHCLEVYKKILSTELKDDIKYLKLALLHDCGKGKTSFFKRVVHKFGFNTSLKNHSEKGYEILKNINEELAILTKNHHKENYSTEMNIFQKCDDAS